MKAMTIRIPEGLRKKLLHLKADGKIISINAVIIKALVKVVDRLEGKKCI